MSKFVLSLLAAVSIGGAAQAQAPIQFGIKGGANLASYAGTDAPEMRYRWGGLGGFTLNVPISREGTYSVQPELLYSQKGYRQADGNSVALEERLHYVDVPVLARINADGLVFEAGPQLGLLVGANGYRRLGESGREAFSSTDAYKRLDVGYAAGVGYQSGSGLGAGLRYNGALTSIAPNGSARNSAFQVFLNYVFVN